VVKTVGIFFDSKFFYPCGIGVFLLSCVKIFKEYNWRICLIVNSPFKNSIKDLNLEDLNIYFNENPIKITEHRQIFQFEEGIQYENVINYRKSFTESLKENIFDLLICNDVESVLCVQNFGLQKYIHVLYYTHCHSIIQYSEIHNSNTDVFSKQYIDFLKNVKLLPGINFATQSELNNKLLDGNCIVLPILYEEKYNPNISENEGILFIGRWDDRKNILFFFDVINKLKKKYNCEYKIKIITKENNKIKFKNKFKEINYNNFEIYANLNEQEKINIISNSKVLFYPLKLEAYCIVIKECMPYIHCLLMKEYGWWKMWDGFVNVTDREEVVDDLFNLYNEPIDRNTLLNNSIKLNNIDKNYWGEYLLNLRNKNIENIEINNKSAFYKYLLNGGTKLKDFFTRLNREPYLSDFLQIYKLKNRFYIKENITFNFIKENKKEIFIGIKDENIA